MVAKAKTEKARKARKANPQAKAKTAKEPTKAKETKETKETKPKTAKEPAKKETKSKAKETKKKTKEPAKTKETPIPPELSKESQTSLVNLSKIIKDNTQIRIHLDEKTIKEYTQQYKDHRKQPLFFSSLPPIEVVYDKKSKKYFMSDGFHRTEAFTRAFPDEKEIEAVVYFGNEKEAILRAIGANQAHGLPRTKADKFNAMETLLLDDEWIEYSDNHLCKLAGCSKAIIKNVLKKWEESGVQELVLRAEKRRGNKNKKAIRKGKEVTQKTENIGNTGNKRGKGKKKTTEEPETRLPEEQQANLLNFDQFSQKIEEKIDEQLLTPYDVLQFIKDSSSYPKIGIIAYNRDRIPFDSKQLQKGLEESWACDDPKNEICFCQPPTNDLDRWMKKAYNENNQKDNPSLLFVPFRLYDKWFWSYAREAATIEIINEKDIEFFVNINGVPVDMKVKYPKVKREHYCLIRFDNKLKEAEKDFKVGNVTIRFCTEYEKVKTNTKELVKDLKETKTTKTTKATETTEASPKKTSSKKNKKKKDLGEATPDL